MITYEEVENIEISKIRGRIDEITDYLTRVINTHKEDWNSKRMKSIFIAQGFLKNANSELNKTQLNKLKEDGKK